MCHDPEKVENPANIYITWQTYKMSTKNVQVVRKKGGGAFIIGYL